MKHIKRVNELYKRTYHDVADKYSGQHPNRAKEIEEYGDKKGISHTGDKENPHRFYLYDHTDVKDFKRTSNFKGYFSIIGHEKEDSYFQVILMSNYNHKIAIRVYLPTNDHNLNITIYYGDGFRGYKNWFRFDNREDAIQFAKYIKDEKLTKFLPINSLYTTRHDKKVKDEIKPNRVWVSNTA